MNDAIALLNALVRLSSAIFVGAPQLSVVIIKHNNNGIFCLISVSAARLQDPTIIITRPPRNSLTAMNGAFPGFY